MNHQPDPISQRLDIATLRGANIYSELADDGVIAVSGVDARTFLQGQLTCDVQQVTLEQSSLGAFCSPKGRVLASLRVLQRPAGLYLELPRVLLDTTLARLSKYILRSKVSLSDASSALRRVGIAGAQVEQLLRPHFAALPTTINQVLHGIGIWAEMSVLRLPGKLPRWQLYAPPAVMQSFFENWGVNIGQTSAETWRLLDVLAGVPRIYPATVEAFVPQMLNLDALGAISFQKGCYTGQEIVARTHYLGKLKRRMVLACVDSDIAPQPGNPLFSPQVPVAQVAGRIVDAVRYPDGGYALLAVALIEAVEHGTLHTEDDQGPLLRLQSLPYSLPSGATC